ncbi:ubiquitin carboxyl-terminal hydrolase 36 [Ceratina calcarata]|uniref:Ubiquitin carboxyl-terminal hydrolase n=1 Tax=Ceratina calcarata TaxID=156304 RepID=A0AAJ7S7N5_9HYME|nr:ubiquitin carboxyl-terminal hydrolase 36 [Ceratina calcarata]XP_026672228.1 ubiquitin carboxyl-terminal hydrolase 36 [Ceratina calcarata]XP_026672229.1 ubiquitin carboxyl-terminal hydrolase 36 [Ceratina calcarata]XP_026672230.1 ubiquitin carboxyl-terminal hydrolase 36 [Ceratina calcarata]
MPAVSICDPVSATLRRTLDTSQSKGQDELSSSLVTSASRILQSEVQYKEVNDYQSAILDQLKAKYTVLSLPNSENDEKKDGIAKKKGPCLPEPAVTLFLAKKVSLGWKGTFPVGAGMFNVGNTCYLNSTLQALFHVPALVNWLLSDSHHNSKCEQNDGAGECLTCAMAKTLQFSHQKSGCAIKPFYIYNKLKLICRTMVPGQQEDAHEFLRYLLDGMKKAYLTRHKANKLDNYSKETTPINQIFGGYVRTEVKCLQCRHVSTTFQHFQDLLVDIRKATTLDEALATYFSREQLENNDYKCEACKRRVPATKQFSVERAPKVLCVQLKRFNVLGGKISKHISFKQTIDMGPYLWREPGEPQQSLTYKLTSMVTHMGPSVNCGHYTAVAKVSTGQYYSFDDSCVRPVSLSNVLSTNAYIMIFEMEPSNLKVNGSISSPTISPVSQLNKSTVGTPKASTSGSAVLNGSVNGLTSKEEDVEKNSSNGVQVKGSGFIGPQLPQKMMEKQPRLIMHIKNGRILNGNCLVPYDGSSEEEENLTSSNGSVKSMVPVNVPNSKSSPVKKENPLAKPVNSTKEAQKSLTKINGNEIVGKVQKNGASYAVVKYQNEKAEANGGTVKSSKWHQTVRGCKDEEKVATKASSIKGWQVSKDTSFGSATSLTAPNGWSVTDKEDNKLPQGTSTSTTTSTSTGATIDVNINSNTTTTTTPSAAAVRNFNGTNQSDTVSHLLRMSLRRYGNSVVNWNGNRTLIDREVDADRREERKRHSNADDDDLDRGRVKKLKTHRSYDDRSSSSYSNPFQEYQEGKTWNSHRAPTPRYYDRGLRHYYNTSGHVRQWALLQNLRTRQRHPRNYRPQHYRYHSRAHWQRG